MKTPVDARFLDEQRVFRLRFACDDCAFFVADPRPRCGNGYPLGERRDRAIAIGDAIEFCKEFEA